MAMRVLVATIAVLTIAACGSSPDGASDPGATLPPASDLNGPIVIAPHTELARMLVADAPPVAVLATDGVEHASASGKVWTVPDDPPTEAEIRRLGEVFGVSGEFHPRDPNRADAVVGDGDHGTEPAGTGALRVTTVGGSSLWNLERSEAFLIESGAIPCPTLPADHPDAGGCANGADPAALPPPAAEDDVRAIVDRVMTAIGVDTYDTEIRAYGPSTEAMVWFLADGARTDVWWALGITPDGAVSSGSGQFRAPIATAEVPTVDLAEVLVRLGRVLPLLPPGTATPPPTTALPTTTAGTVAPGTETPEVIAVPTTIAVPLPPAEPPVITSVAPTLTAIWDVSNRMWLIPALTVTGTGGFVATIPTISADAVRIADPSEIDVPTMTAPPIAAPTPMPTAAPIPPDLSSAPIPPPAGSDGGVRHPLPQPTATTSSTTTTTTTTTATTPTTSSPP